MRQTEKRKKIFIAGIVSLAVGLIFFYKSLSEKENAKINRDFDSFFLFSRKETTPGLIFDFLFNNALSIDQKNKIILSFDSAKNTIMIQIQNLETKEALSYNEFFAKLIISETDKTLIDSIFNHISKDFRRQFYSNKNAVLINLKYVFTSKELASQILVRLIENNSFNLPNEKKEEILKRLREKINFINAAASSVNDNYFIAIDKEDCKLIKRKDDGILSKIKFEIMVDYDSDDASEEKRGKHKNFNFRKNERLLSIDFDIANIQSVYAADFYIKEIVKSLMQKE